MGKKLPINNEIVSTIQFPSEKNNLERIIEQTDNKIKKGLERKIASTGTPINKLNGGSKFMAQLSNIGEGSVATGGGGIKEGFNTIFSNVNAKTKLESIQIKTESKPTKIKK